MARRRGKVSGIGCRGFQCAARASACSIARNRSLSLTGLGRKSTAPPFIALTLIGMSAWPVMKTIGRFALVACNSEVQAAETGHANVQHKTRGTLAAPLAIEEFTCRAKGLHVISRRFDQPS
jgi:hypothetical protein